MILKFNLRWFYSRYPAIKATAEENMYLCNWAFDWNPPWESLTAFPLWQQSPSPLYITFFSLQRCFQRQWLIRLYSHGLSQEVISQWHWWGYAS